MGPFLYSCFSYTASQRRGELPIAQRDAFPGAEYIEEHSEAIGEGNALRASFGLDRYQNRPTFGDIIVGQQH
ncbi:MAG: hypothetical protein DMD54_00720 [Gemmatimonadetes bacterium]|nr:MAG: hypothetical protein DMD54_00720 [Gemmatimonadota bacterium]